MKVAIMTHSEENESFAFVARAIEEKGHEVLRCNTDLYPTELLLSSYYTPEGEEMLLSPAENEPPVDLNRVDAVWNRRFRYGSRLPADLDPQLREPSIEESRRSFLGMIHSLDTFCLDDLKHSHHARSKPLQLKLARRLGLDIPRTLISNEAEQVRSFAAASENGIVCKMMTAFAVFDEEGRDHVVFTNPVSAEDLEELDGLKLCPMTFQENLSKALELRVTVVGHRVFTAAIDSQASERARHDWRRDGAGMIDRWRPYELPVELERRLLALCDELRLNYGAIDLILTPDSRYVFLEINPAGEFFWIETHAGHPISSAIADVLTDPEKRRVR